MKNRLWLIAILVLLIIGLVGTVTASASQRPVPPAIQTYGIPVTNGYAHDCGTMPTGATSCGVVCYYITEESGYELSCVPAWFTN